MRAELAQAPSGIVGPRPAPQRLERRDDMRRAVEQRIVERGLFIQIEYARNVARTRRCEDRHHEIRKAIVEQYRIAPRDEWSGIHRDGFFQTAAAPRRDNLLAGAIDHDQRD